MKTEISRDGQTVAESIGAEKTDGASTVADRAVPDGPQQMGEADAAIDTAGKMAEACAMPDMPAGSTIVMVDPRELHPHPTSVKLFGFGTAEENVALTDNVATKKVTDPLIVCGERCSSPPNTILAGHRRAASATLAGLLVPVIYLNDLSVDDEKIVIIQTNLAGEYRRKLTEEQKYAAESMLRRILGNRQGERTDLTTSVSSDRSSGASPASGASRTRTRKQVAKIAGESESAIAQRLAIYGSPITPPELKAAVNEKKISRDAAAKLVRAQEREVKQGLDEDAASRPLEQKREHAKAKLSAQTAQILAKVRKKRPSAAKAGKPVADTVLSGVLVGADGVFHELDQLEAHAAALMTTIRPVAGLQAQPIIEGLGASLMRIKRALNLAGDSPGPGCVVAEEHARVEGAGRKINDLKAAMKGLEQVLRPIQSGGLRRTVGALINYSADVTQTKKADSP